jgi:uncharacterized protein YodC (DUF2158 family)
MDLAAIRLPGAGDGCVGRLVDDHHDRTAAVQADALTDRERQISARAEALDAGDKFDIAGVKFSSYQHARTVSTQEPQMAENFKPGDVVQLKSGGPKMTVEQVGQDAVLMNPAVWCSWFVGTRLQKEVFSPDALDRAKV